MVERGICSKPKGISKRATTPAGMVTRAVTGTAIRLATVPDTGIIWK